MVRYNTDGNFDKSFADKGRLFMEFFRFREANSMAIQSDGKIIVAGYEEDRSPEGLNRYLTLHRFNTNGSYDDAFTNRLIRTNYHYDSTIANAIVVQSDDKIVVAGSKGVNLLLARFHKDGEIDSTFTMQVTSFGSFGARASSVVLQEDGKIIVGGSNDQSFVLARYYSNGNLDNSFSEDGKQVTDASFGADTINSIAVEAGDHTQQVVVNFQIILQL